MKKIIFLTLLLAHGIAVYSCDVCGCSLGGNYYGILPLYNKNFVGLRWSQAKFYAYMDHHSDYLPPEHSNDTYSKVELWGRFYINKRLQVFAFVPYSYNTMNGTEQVVSAHGLGDITVMANYLLINTGEDKEKKFKHTWLAGGGIKLPTGSFNLQDQGKIVNRNFQMGTGSTDFLVTSVYTVRYQKVGMNIESGYKINTRNSDDYLFGNQFHASTQFFYWQNLKPFSLLPNAGLYYETAARHKEGNILQAKTGGEALLFTAGLETYYKTFTLGVSYQSPIAQKYNSDNVATITSRNRWGISLTYNF
jgi:hypothetical protein